MLLLARLCVLVTLLAHLAALALSGADAASTPISQLSRAVPAWIHSSGLVALAVSWILIGTGFWRRSTGIVWRSGCVLLLASAALLPYIAYYFATAAETVLFSADANDPLALLASLLGIAMGALQPGLARSSKAIGAANLLILLLWIGLVAVIPFLNADVLGAYERTVGALMLLWTAILTFSAGAPDAGARP
jgi:hypothetical protein